MISHDLEEIIERTDSITIMRDGEVIDTKESSTLTPDILKRMMVGRDVSGAYYRSDTKESFDDQVVLEVRDLSVSGEFSDVSFELHKGEILGICGLSGAGIHSLGNAIFGLKKPAKGSIYLPLQNKYIKSPLDAIRKGLAYVPKDRDKEALMVTASIEDNICLPSIKELGGFMGFISPSKKKELAAKAVTEYEVKTTGIKQYMNRLSGGNRQKVNLARWMSRDINIIIMDCPTRGVDVGVKAYIYDIMNKAKKDGLSIIMISDELPELIGMSDRMLVMKDGRLVKTFNRSSGLSEESIIEVMI